MQIFYIGSPPDPDSLMPDRSVQVRCPGCGQQGTFDALPVYDARLVTQDGRPCITGVRACPAEKCRCLLFFILDQKQGELLATYPTETLDFDASGVPIPVSEALSEAVNCHGAQCYTAAAMMVRKTLEALCEDQGATGNNLYERIKNLRSVIVLPDALLEGLNELRLLGNDAAHVESKTFDQVGQAEVEVCIDVAKEVLKAVYQYSSLVERIRSLKPTP